MRAGVLAAALLVVCAPTGCSRVATGSARPAVTAATLLPSAEQISGAVGNPLSTFGFKAFVGGVEIMPDGFRSDADASPIACIGATDTMTRITYERTAVTEAARQSFFTLDPTAPVTGADAAAIRFADATAARETFDGFARTWAGCDGRTVVKRLRGTTGADVAATVSGVARSGPVLIATLVTRQGRARPARYARALQVRANVIVEVSLAIGPDAPVGDDGREAAKRVAVVMADQVG